MTFGPVDFIALEFEGNHFKGDILASLADLVEQKIVRVIDLVVIVKDEEGEIMVREIQQLDNEVLAIFDPQEISAAGMITEADIEMVGEALDNNTSAGVLLFENLWAIKFKEALIEAGGNLLMQERIPHEVVLEALVDMANFDESAVEETD
ncbi:MAG: DUF6325 family protein [Candidatus Promineifilaceae bacterium]|jgi:hypothetical protein